MNIKRFLKGQKKADEIIEHVNNIDTLITKIISDKEFIKNNPYAFMSFTEMIFHFIRIKFPNEKDSIIYKRANIDAKLFNKIKRL